MTIKHDPQSGTTGRPDLTALRDDVAWAERGLEEARNELADAEILANVLRVKLREMEASST